MEGKDNKGSWFDDDPEWVELRNRIEGQPAPKPKKRALTKHKHENPPETPQNVPEEPKKVEVSVKFTLPKVKLPKTPKISRRQLVIGGSVVGGLVVLFAAYTIFSRVTKKTDKPSSEGAAQQVTKPPFESLFPDGKEETASSQIRYYPATKSASFEDMIGSIPITVSQQELPASFKENTDDEVKKLAEGFSANEVLAESNPKAYIGTSVKGPQTVIFHKNGLLVFIKSTRTIDRDQWAAYITTLQ